MILVLSLGAVVEHLKQSRINHLSDHTTVLILVS